MTERRGMCERCITLDVVVTWMQLQPTHGLWLCLRCLVRRSWR